MPTITTIGSLNTDLTSVVPHFPRPGETLSSSTFTTAPGGKGLNQCLATARLSHRSTTAAHMVGCVGSDSFSPHLLAALRSDGVDISGVRVVPAVSSGVAVITVDAASGDNTILVHAGANACVEVEGVGDTDLVVLQCEIPMHVVCAVVEMAWREGVAVMLNAAPAGPLPESCYAMVRYLIVNETEAAALVGVEEGELEREDGVRAVAETLRGRGARNVVVTLGARGCYWVSEDGAEGFGGVVARKEDVVDTTGAGDTFVGALAVAVTEGRAMQECVEFAGRAAGIAVTRRGAVAGIPYREEVDEL